MKLWKCLKNRILVLTRWNKKKSNRVSSLKNFSEDLPSPEEIEKKVEAVTKPKVEEIKVVPKKEEKIKDAQVKKTALNKKRVQKKSKTASGTEVIKFVKIGGDFHRLAKIEAAKNSLSLKAYLELLIEKNSSL